MSVQASLVLFQCIHEHALVPQRLFISTFIQPFLILFSPSIAELLSIATDSVKWFLKYLRKNKLSLAYFSTVTCI